MRKVLGIFVFLCVLATGVAVLSPHFLTYYNLSNLGRWIGEFGIAGIGEALVIITGGIDLSVGSVIGLTATIMPMLVVDQEIPFAGAALLVLTLSTSIGLAHGLLITKLRLQPFVVTLCGLFVYRGIARMIAEEKTQGYGVAEERAFFFLAKGVVLGVPMPLVILLAVTILVGIFLHGSVYGRYLFAVGRNEQAALYSGIRTHRLVIAAYCLCSLCAGIAGILFSIDINSMQPSSFGNFYELYAIAAAVLGGCSLRGGEGNVIGVVIGTAVLQLLRNAINLLQISSAAEMAVIGGVLLAGVTLDELVKRYAAARRAAQRVTASRAAPVGVTEEKDP